MLATLREEFFMKEEILLLLIRMMMCFLDSPLVVILIWGFGLLCPWTILFTWSIFLAFKVGTVSLIFKMTDVLVEVLETYVYDLVVWLLDNLLVLLSKVFLGWKYLEMTFISFLDLAGRGERGGALLIMTGVNLGVSFLELPLGRDIHRVNFEERNKLKPFLQWN